MGMLSGFLGGMGKGLTEGSKMAYDQRMLEDRDAKQYERQVQRDYVAAARQDVRDERNHQQMVERDREQLKNRLEEVRQAAVITNELNQKFGAAALSEIQQVRERLGPKASDAQVRAGLRDPNAIKAFDAQTAFVNGQRKLDDDLKTNAAQRAASGATAANAHDAIKGRQQERKTATQERTDAARVRELQALIPRVKASGNTAALEAVQAEIISLSGVDPLATKKGNWKEVEETNKFGEKTVTGWRDLDTGEFRPNTPAAADGGNPPVPGAQLAEDGNWYVKQNGKYFRVDSK